MTNEVANDTWTENSCIRGAGKPDRVKGEDRQQSGRIRDFQFLRLQALHVYGRSFILPRRIEANVLKKSQVFAELSFDCLVHGQDQQAEAG